MKKYFLFYAFAMLCTVSLFTACSDDDDNDDSASSSNETELWETISTSEITGSSLSLTVNGEAGSSDASVKITPTSATAATIQLLDVISGYSDLTVSVDMTASGSSSYTYSGTTKVNTAPQTRAVSADDAILAVEVTGTITVSSSATQVTMTVTADGAGLYLGTYDGDNLTLTYSGSTLPGKTVYYSVTGSVPILTLVNVIPGELSTSIAGVYATNGAFSGTATTDNATVSYEGQIAASGGMTLALDVTLNDNAQGGLAGTWALTTALGVDFNSFEVSKLPFMIDWTITGTDMTQTNYGLSMMISSPLTEFLSNVTFNADGNITAKYATELCDELKAAGYSDFMSWANTPNIDMTTYSFKAINSTWLESPLNMAMWYVNDGQLYILPILENILAQVIADRGSSTVTILGADFDLTSLDAETIIALAGYIGISSETITEWLTYGIPVKYDTQDDGSLKIYVDKDMIDPIMTALLPFITTYGDTLLGDYSDYISALFGFNLSDLSTIWEYTTGFDLALVLEAE